MTRFRAFALLLAAAAMSVALIACDSGSADGDATPGETSTSAPTGTQPGDGSVSSNDPTETPTSDGNQNVGDTRRVEELAPIESAEVRFAESFPVQHLLHVVSGLPSGCAAFEDIEVEREGTVFTVTVTNTMPAPDQEIACTMIYGYHESNVALGNDLESGTEYTVHVNDMTLTFVAQ